MPKYCVKIENIEELDRRLADLVENEQAVLIQSNDTFSSIFPKTMDSSRVFTKKYTVFLSSGNMLSAKKEDIYLYFDYRDNYAQLNISNNAKTSLCKLLSCALNGSKRKVDDRIFIKGVPPVKIDNGWYEQAGQWHKIKP